MRVGILTAALIIENANSLKSKRMVLHSLTARLRNNFNVSVAQVADEDKWQKSTLAIAAVGRSGDGVDRTLSNSVNFIRDFPGVTLIDYGTELL